MLRAQPAALAVTGVMPMIMITTTMTSPLAPSILLALLATSQSVRIWGPKSCWRWVMRGAALCSPPLAISRSGGCGRLSPRRQGEARAIIIICLHLQLWGSRVEGCRS